MRFSVQKNMIECYFNITNIPEKHKHLVSFNCYRYSVEHQSSLVVNVIKEWVLALQWHVITAINGFTNLAYTWITLFQAYQDNSSMINSQWLCCSWGLSNVASKLFDTTNSSISSVSSISQYPIFCKTKSLQILTANFLSLWNKKRGWNICSI